jgi:hypothetical protein
MADEDTTKQDESEQEVEGQSMGGTLQDEDLEVTESEGTGGEKPGEDKMVF